MTAQDDLGKIIDIVRRNLCFLSVQMGNPTFMLAEADVSSIAASALRKGLNRLWVKIDSRRDGAKFDLYMGELEIVSLR